jgi:hypothetical protein
MKIKLYELIFFVFALGLILPRAFVFADAPTVTPNQFDISNDYINGSTPFLTITNDDNTVQNCYVEPAGQINESAEDIPMTSGATSSTASVFMQTFIPNIGNAPNDFTITSGSLGFNIACDGTDSNNYFETINITDQNYPLLYANGTSSPPSNSSSTNPYLIIYQVQNYPFYFGLAIILFYIAFWVTLKA